ncbi:MAG: PrgI family protein [Candidatus Ryanbacteria bacterium]|nr:PrgI family protein [Candidatus Ryanbacteria bacterium]
MQQFQVPQYIEIEDKIVGQLTVKQLIYVLGGGGVILLLWALKLPWFIFWPLAIAAAAFFGGLAFFEINGQPLVTYINNALNHFTHRRRYMWVRKAHEAPKKPVIEKRPITQGPQLTESKLKNLSWSLDINQKIDRI